MSSAKLLVRGRHYASYCQLDQNDRNHLSESSRLSTCSRSTLSHFCMISWAMRSFSDKYIVSCQWLASNTLTFHVYHELITPAITSIQCLTASHERGHDTSVISIRNTDTYSSRNERLSSTQYYYLFISIYVISSITVMALVGILDVGVSSLICICYE